MVIGTIMEVVYVLSLLYGKKQENHILSDNHFRDSGNGYLFFTG